jgi:RHS repeat-associated protein
MTTLCHCIAAAWLSLPPSVSASLQATSVASVTTQTRTLFFGYDTLHRLTQERSEGVSPSLTGTVSYTLDAVGNRTQRTSTLSAVPNQAQTHDVNDCPSLRSRPANWLRILLAACAAWQCLTTDTTDANGNTLASASLRSEGVSPSSVTTTDLYDFENRLIRRVENPATTSQKTIDVLYDADGNRVAKRSDDWQSSSPSVTHYLVDSNNPTGYTQVLEEHITTPAAGASDPFSLSTYPSSLATVYAYGQDLISQDRKTGPTTWSLSFYCYDGGGHVRALANEVGTLTDTYTFDAFGVLITRTGTTENNYLYRGEQFDPDLHLYYQRARYLNADTGRFWTQDTYEGSPGTPASLHKYFYANGDPVSGWDPSGHISLFEVMKVGAVMGALNGALVSYANGGTGLDIITGAAFGGLSGALLAPVMMVLPPPVTLGIAIAGTALGGYWAANIVMSSDKSPGQKGAAIGSFLSSLGGSALASKWMNATRFKTDIGAANRDPKFLVGLLRNLGIEVHEQIYVKVPGHVRGRFYDIVVRVFGKFYALESKATPREFNKYPKSLQYEKDVDVVKDALPISGKAAKKADILDETIQGVYRLLWPFDGW